MAEITIEIEQRKCPECDGVLVRHNKKMHALGDYCLDCMTCGLFFREDGSQGPRLEVGRKYLYVPAGGGMVTYKGMKGRVHQFVGSHGHVRSLFGDEVMEQIVIDDTLELKAAVRELHEVLDGLVANLPDSELDLAREALSNTNVNVIVHWRDKGKAVLTTTKKLVSREPAHKRMTRLLRNW